MISCNHAIRQDWLCFISAIVHVIRSVTQCPHLQSLLDILSVASILISNQLCVSFDYLYVLIRSFLFTFPSVKFESSLSLYSF